MKVYGNVGRYFLPVANVINIKQAGPFLDRRTFYAFNGFGTFTNPTTGISYPSPILGPQIGGIDDSQGQSARPATCAAKWTPTWTRSTRTS